MFRQIVVHPNDRDLQRIFWHDHNGQVCPYRLTTVTYGLNCAPFLALRVMQQLVVDEGHRYPKAVPAITTGRYVDDIFGGSESMEETQVIINQVRQLCMAGGFQLQKWKSNSRELLKNLSLISDDEGNAVEFESSRVKVLGLCWQPKDDNFQFTSIPSQSRKLTKRSILSEISQIYDPLGFISPVIIRAKILIQDLWLAKVNWDEPLSSELQNRWITFRSQLSSLNNLRIPRYLEISSTALSIQLHGFSDASNLAMAAVIYVRIETSLHKVLVNLICSKTKVAPLKRLTIPRLELNAALLLARLTSKTQTALNLPNIQVFLWTDSAVTLYWVATSPAKWKDYVRNRVESIQDTLPLASWRFTPGKENPADCATRGVTVQQLEHHELWWSGPSWLRQSSDEWPKLNSIPSVKADKEEKSSHTLITSLNTKVFLWDLLERYSTLTRLLLITSLCRRAVNCFKNSGTEPSSVGPLTPIELRQSCEFWVRCIQQAYFPSEVEILAKRDQLSKTNPLIKLTPFIDSSGLLRVGGRLQQADLCHDAKHPYILPRHSTLTNLIISDSHLQTLHGGTQLTLAHIRQKYWIVGGRVPVRSFILKCVKCSRLRQIRAQQLMGQLPIARVTPSRPFLNTGVDYAGPISIKTWKGRAAKCYKGYLAIFVCFSTSAVHIEVVTDYSTEAFIAAYKRFTARRGICATLNSDCGTNFVGADRELRRLFSAASSELRELATILANQGTEWRFNPPSAPHFGGKWEAAVKSTKFHLRRIIGDAILTYEELSTIMAQIEAVLNSRPLCPLSEDADDFNVLTPGNFLRLTRWQLLQQKVQQFWRLWKVECLQRYQAISKWHHASKVKEGSLVLLVDERYPPTKWPLARIQQLHPGKDGLVRVVTLRTATAQFKRPINKIVILPVDPEYNTFGNSVSEDGRKNVEERQAT